MWRCPTSPADGRITVIHVHYFWFQPMRFCFLCGCEKVGARSKTSLLHQLSIDIPEQISGTHAQPDTTRQCQQHHCLVHTAPYKGDSTLHPSEQHASNQRVSRFTSLASGKAKGSSPAPSSHHCSLVMPHQCVCKDGVHLQHK